MWGFIKRFFRKRKKIDIDINSPTVPGAFGYPEEEFSVLVNELSYFIKDDDRLVTFDNYINSPFFTKFHLNLNNPKHAAVLGYAFCSAVMIRRTMQKKRAQEGLFEHFAKIKTDPGMVN